MKIVRFFGLDSASAVQQAKDRLGNDAVIFSHREIAEGVEVLATATTQPNKNTTSYPEKRKSGSVRRTQTNDQSPAQVLFTHLMQLGLGVELATQLAYQTNNMNFSTPQTAIRDAHAELAKTLPTLQQPVIAAGKTIALLGSESAGKTTTLIKLARQAMENEEIAALNFLTPENLSESASLALQQQLAHPNTTVSTAIDAFDLARIRFDARQPTLTLVDNLAISQQDMRQPQKLLTASMRGGVDNYLLLPANLASNALEQIVSAMSAGMKLKGCIITMVDKCDSLGPIFAISIKHKLPIALWSDGESLDSHLYAARPKHLVEKAIAVQRTGAAAAHLPEQQFLPQLSI